MARRGPRLGARVQARHAIGDRIARGQDQHRPRVAAAAHRAEYVQARALGQAQVEHDRIVRMLSERQLRGAAVLDPVDGETVLAQALADAGTDNRVVLGEEHAHGRSERGVQPLSLGSNLSDAEFMQ